MPVLTSRWNPVTYPEDGSITDYILKGAERFGDNVALVDSLTDDSLTFKEVISLVKRFGSYLRKHGVRKHDVVIIFLGNSIFYPVLFHAIAGIGAVVSTCNPNGVPASIRSQILLSKAKFVFTQTDFVESVKEAIQGSNEVKAIWVMGDRHWREMLSDDGSAWPTYSPVTNPKKEVAFLPYSSGTTGLPKGVMLSHSNLIAHEAIISQPMFNMGTHKDVFVFPMPMFHSYGSFLIHAHALRQGIKVVSMPRFEPSKWLEQIEKHKVSLLQVVPPMVVFLAKSPIVNKYDLSSVRTLFCGAAPLGKDTQAQVEARLKNIQIFQGYGMTEFSPLVCVEPVGDIKQGASGCLLPNTEAKVIDVSTGKELGPNQEGELCFRGPQAMLGYLGNPEATKNTIKNGWIHTGDIGRYDDDGHFYIVDRIKDLIKYKAFQVAPAELEDLLMTHPGIAEICVVGVPSEEAGELPKAFCVKKNTHGHVTEDDIKKFVADRCESYKRLRGGVEFLPEIPKTASGKLLRKTLRDMAKRKSKL